MSFIYHIVEKDYFHTQEKEEAYFAPSLEAEGFIHFSKIDQLLQVANSFYKGKTQLFILKVDSDKLTHELKFEPPLEAPNSGILFPHLYGKLNWDALIEKFDWTANDDGSFTLPELL